MMWTRTFCCVVLATMCACGGAAPATDPAPTQDPQPTPPAPEATQAASYDTKSPVGVHAAWVLDVLNNREGKVDDAEIKEHFSAQTLQLLPAEQLRSVFVSLGASFTPLTVSDVTGEKSDQVALLLESGNPAHKGTKLVMLAAVEPNNPAGKLIMLQFKPPSTPADQLAKSWKELKGLMGTAAAHTILSVSEIDPASGACSPMYSHKSSQSMPLGSSFKLYVLAATADLVQAGKLAWDKKYPIKDALKSLPSGSMQNQPAGKMFSIQEYANAMISVSDNTATDHLMDIVGRATIEGMLDSTGNGQRHAKPFLTTQEMFKLKVGPKATRDAYAAGDVSKRRALLKTLASKPLPTLKETLTALKSPRNIRDIEWFASAKDMCGLHAHIVQNASKPAYAGALEAMSINSGGLKLDKEAWPYVGFKGGSEPGVLYLSYLVRHKDGRWLSVNLGMADEQKAVDESKIPAIVQSVGTLLK